MKLPIDSERIEAHCRAHHIIRLSIFGSALGDDFSPSSDVDVLVRFEDNAPISLFDFVRISNDLSEILGRHVDLGDESGLLESGDPDVREAILRTAVPVYVAA